MEVLGIYIAHASVSEMVAAGDLALEVGAYLNAALSMHSFCALHACSHHAVSQHSKEHEAFENTVYRLAGLPIFFDDSFRRHHTLHHSRTNSEEDPDHAAAVLSLPELGQFLNSAHNLHIPTATPWFHWDDVLTRYASVETLKALLQADDQRLQHVGRTLEVTWHRAAGVAKWIAALMFSRFPHRHGTNGIDHELASFFDGTCRAQDQVDLWMMGEGYHHGHHAKSDIPYTVLAKVGAELEERHPEMKLASRGMNGRDDRELGGLSDKLTLDEPAPDQRSWRRTLLAEGFIDMMETDVLNAIVGFADTVISSALDVTTTADLRLLRNFHHEMKLREAEHSGPVPMAGWQESVLADSTQAALVREGARIKTRVRKSAEHVGNEFIAAGGKRTMYRSDIKGEYLRFFTAVFRACLKPRNTDLHPATCMSTLLSSEPKGADVETVPSYLESTLPSGPIQTAWGQGSEHRTQSRAANLLSQIRSRL